MAAIAGVGASRLSISGIVAYLVLGISGCGADPALPKLGKVHGTVTLKGKPVEAGHIVFTPDANKGGVTGQSATAEIQAGGTYQATTFSDGDGAILGEHVVTVQLRKPGEDAFPKPNAKGTIEYKLPKNLAPSKYSKVEKSPLRHIVTAEGGVYDINLED